MRPHSLLRLLAVLLTVLCAAPVASAPRKAPRGSDENGEVKAERALGGLRYSIQVRKFNNEAAWPYGWQLPPDNSGGLGNAFSTVLTNALQESKHFIVVAGKEMTNEVMEEQDFSSQPNTIIQGSKTPRKGQMTPAQLLVKGSITRIAPDKSFINVGGGNSRGLGKFLNGGGRSKTEIDVTIQVVDATTRMVVASKTVTGTTSKMRLGLTRIPIVRNVDVGSNPDAMGAVVNAVNQSVDFLVEQLSSIPWTGSVVSTTGRIIINRGEREGVREGMRFSVGSIERISDPDTGELLDQNFTSVGTIKVTEVREKSSYCTAVRSRTAIKVGMAVSPAAAVSE